LPTSARGLDRRLTSSTVRSTATLKGTAIVASLPSRTQPFTDPLVVSVFQYALIGVITAVDKKFRSAPYSALVGRILPSPYQTE